MGNEHTIRAIEEHLIKKFRFWSWDCLVNHYLEEHIKLVSTKHDKNEATEH